MILAAGYLLWMFQRIFTGELSDFLRGARRPPDRHQPDRDPDRSCRSATLVVVFGLFPGLLLHLIQGTVSSVVGRA